LDKNTKNTYGTACMFSPINYQMPNFHTPNMNSKLTYKKTKEKRCGQQLKSSVWYGLQELPEKHIKHLNLNLHERSWTI